MKLALSFDEINYTKNKIKVKCKNTYHVQVSSEEKNVFHQVQQAKLNNAVFLGASL